MYCLVANDFQNECLLCVLRKILWHCVEEIRHTLHEIHIIMNRYDHTIQIQYIQIL